jgi:lysozyme
VGRGRLESGHDNTFNLPFDFLGLHRHHDTRDFYRRYRCGNIQRIFYYQRHHEQEGLNVNLLNMIKIDEGFSATPYVDSEGYVTIGYGWKLSNKDADLSSFCLTVTETADEFRLNEDINQRIASMKRETRLDLALTACMDSPPRYSGLVSMSYQLGISGINQFKNMLAAAIAHDWEGMKNHALDSKWAHQTPNRANRISGMFESGEWDEYYLNAGS